MFHSPLSWTLMVNISIVIFGSRWLQVTLGSLAQRGRRCDGLTAVMFFDEWSL